MSEWPPDWKNPVNYPDTEKCPGYELCWEFLRRNESYQQDFKKFHQNRDDMGYAEAWAKINDRQPGEKIAFTELERKKARAIINEGQKLLIAIERKYGILTGIYSLPDPALPLNEQATIFPKQQKYSPGILDYSTGGLARQHFFMSKNKNTPSPFLFREPDKELFSKNIGIPANFTMSPRKLYVEIDLEGKIEQQINIIKSAAVFQHEKLIELGLVSPTIEVRRVGIYTEYLQILDAITAGISKNEIAATLLPNEPNEYPNYAAIKKINNRLNAAIKLRDHTYLSLLDI